MKFFMFIEDNKVTVKGSGKEPSEGAHVISPEQYLKEIYGATVNALPVYNDEGEVIVDADLTLI